MNVNHTLAVLQEVREERARQNAKWGEQNHPSTAPVPSITVNSTSIPAVTSLLTRAYYGLKTAGACKDIVDAHARNGTLTFGDIHAEELAEALECENEVDMRRELVQLAAVTVAWIEAIDRRTNNVGHVAAIHANPVDQQMSNLDEQERLTKEVMEHLETLPATPITPTVNDICVEMARRFVDLGLYPSRIDFAYDVTLQQIEGRPVYRLVADLRTRTLQPGSVIIE